MKKRVVSIVMAVSMVAATMGLGTTASAEEVTTLRIAMKDVSMENELQKAWMDEFNAALQEAGIMAQLEVVEMQSGTYSDNLALMLNSGDIPDIIYFQGGDQVFSDQGVMEDLTPYIENSTYVKDALEDFQKERLANYP